MTRSALSMYLQVQAALYVSCGEKRDEIEKTHLHGLASVLGLLPTYKAYKDRDPFDEKVAVTLLSELLDKVILTTRSE